MPDCLSTDHAVALALSAGNRVQSITTGWSKVEKVVYMADKLTPSLRQRIQASEPSLRYRHSEASPHNPPEEGFICEKHKIAISFPK